jgi:methylenetetrahydrofolate--tRNA-(uracil-5-)-methyltransferase
VQLRQEDAASTAFNLVGFQTRMKWPEQKRVFAMIPGLLNVEFLRYGAVHRNTFVNAPKVLDDQLGLPGAPGVHLAGQITGVEGYVESAACGLLLGAMLAQKLRGEGIAMPGKTTAFGSLYGHLRTPSDRFQPSNVIFSMFPLMDTKARKRERHEELAERALVDIEPWLEAIGAREVVARLPKLPEKQVETVEATP